MTKPSFFLLGLLAAGLTLSVRADDTAVIAKVGGDEIQIQAIKPYLDSLDARARGALERDPSLLNQVVRAFILQQVLFKEASAVGWEKKPEVAKQIESLREGAVAESYLQAVTEVPADYPTDAQVAAAFDARKDQLILPRQFQLAQIFVVAPKDADKATQATAQAKMDAIQKSLKQSGADFAAIAKAQSEERESATQGGSVGWLAENAIQPDIRSRITALHKGDTTDVVQLPDGLYIVKILDLKESRPATLDEVRPQIVKLLRDDRSRMNRESYMAKLQQQNPVAINELALASLLPAKK